MTEPKARAVIELDESLLHQIDVIRPPNVSLSRFLGVICHLGFEAMKLMAREQRGKKAKP